MVQDVELAAALVDVVFDVQGRAVPRDHAAVLHEAIAVHLPWWNQEPGVGIHPLKLVAAADGQSLALLARRTRLLLRVPRERLADTIALSGADLALGPHHIQIGQGHTRELLAHATLYAYHVFSPDGDEVRFMDGIHQELEQLGIRFLSVCGKNHVYRLGGREVSAFSLMLHGLSPKDSLRIQERGLGPHRHWGCGLFVPHKSAAAVGV